MEPFEDQLDGRRNHRRGLGVVLVAEKLLNRSHQGGNTIEEL
jgi:hypothetical protein